MSDIRMVVRFCTIENVLVEYSQAYKLLLDECGPVVANFFTEEIDLPRDEPCETSTPQLTSLSAL